MKKYKICIILINFNSADYTVNCIKSIKEFVDKNVSYNIVIIDNNSKVEDYEKLKLFVNNYDDIQTIRSKINLGFSGGNMLGVQFADAEYIYFLNNDTLLLNDCLSILYKFMEANKNAGICTGQMYNTDMTFHHSFNYFPTLSLKLFGSSLLRLINPLKYPQKKKEYTAPLQVDFTTGAAMFIDYSKFAEVGGFDTNYFLYCEEEDIAMKLKRAGYYAYIVPEAKFIHHMGKSTVRNFEIEKENYISILYFQRKYSNYIVYQLYKIFCFFKIIKKSYKNIAFLKLAFFILGGANLKYSLKHKQKINI